MDDEGRPQGAEVLQEKLWGYRIGDSTAEAIPESKLKELITAGISPYLTAGSGPSGA